MLIRLTAALFSVCVPLTVQAADCGPSHTPGPATIVEVVRYQLAEGLSEVDYLNNVEPTQSFLCAQPGFVRRFLSRGEDGTWIDVAEWESLELATAASERAMQEPALAAFMQSANPETIDFRYLDIRLRVE